MSTLPTPPQLLVSSVATAPNFWQQNILWSVLVSSDQTGGDFSLMEQLMPQKAGPPPHVHDQSLEMFYILEGEMALQLHDQVITGKPGQLIRIPPGTPHAFVVVTATARVLNFYVPGILDREIAMLGTPASSPVLPSAGTQTPPTPEQQKALTDRLHDLATQSWSSQADLLAHLR